MNRRYYFLSQWCVLSMAILSVWLFCPSVQAQLFGPQLQAFDAPDGSFRISIPQQWLVQFDINGTGSTTRFVPTGDSTTALTVNVAPWDGALNATLVRAQQRDTRLMKQPNAVLMQERSMMLGGYPAETILISYWYQGNAAYPRLVEETFWIADGKLYTLQFDCAQPSTARYAQVLNTIYNSIQSPVPTEKAAPQKKKTRLKLPGLK